LYRFDDWAGPETVEQLYEQYLDRVKAFIEHSVAKGFLTAA
jgi:hypothetical protein